MRFGRLLAVALATALLAGCGGGDGDSEIPEPGGDAPRELGFPDFATKNTTRVGGEDEAANAAAVALATYPSGRPRAVALADSRSWAEALVATSLMAEPLGAPVLLSRGGDLPEPTREALDALRPRGTRSLRGAGVVRIGDAPSPGGVRTQRVAGATPAAVAAEVDELRARLTGRRSPNVLVISEAEPAHAMAAAGWAARSGDPILITGRNSVPAATRRALARHPRDTRVYVLGPPSAVSSRAFRALGRLPRVGRVRRITGADPVETSVVFSRYLDGSFGWNVNDPGHGFAVVRETRPLDAVAAAPLSARGKFGPILVTDQPGRLPGALRSFFLDLQPGYRGDPVRAVYNHIWILGDLDAIAASQQAALDELAEATKIEIAPRPQRRQPRPRRRNDSTGDVPSDEEVQETLEDLLEASPDRGGGADR